MKQEEGINLEEKSEVKLPNSVLEGEGESWANFTTIIGCKLQDCRWGGGCLYTLYWHPPSFSVPCDAVCCAGQGQFYRRHWCWFIERLSPTCDSPQTSPSAHCSDQSQHNDDLWNCLPHILAAPLWSGVTGRNTDQSPDQSEFCVSVTFIIYNVQSLPLTTSIHGW